MYGDILGRSTRIYDSPSGALWGCSQLATETAERDLMYIVDAVGERDGVEK